jgi:hypothetical protein
MIAVIERVKTNIYLTMETISIYIWRNKLYIYRACSLSFVTELMYVRCRKDLSQGPL